MIQVIELGVCSIQANNRIAIRNDIVKKYNLRQDDMVIVDIRIPLPPVHAIEVRETTPHVILEDMRAIFQVVQTSINAILRDELALSPEGSEDLKLTVSLLESQVKTITSRIELIQ